MAACVLLVSHGSAQSAPAPAPTESLPPIFTSAAAASDATPTALAAAPVPPAPAISPELAATISTALPQYQDPSAQPAAVPGASAQPRNQIPRLPAAMVLPPVTVHERRIREFTERESYTRKGLEELAVKRYLSDFDRYFLNRFTLPIIGVSKEDRAMQLFDQDEAIARNKEEAALWRLDALKDPEEKPVSPPAP